MSERGLYEFIIVAIVFFALGIIIFIGGFILAATLVQKIRKSNEKKDEDNEKRISEVQKLFKEDVKQILDKFKNILKT